MDSSTRPSRFPVTAAKARSLLAMRLQTRDTPVSTLDLLDRLWRFRGTLMWLVVATGATLWVH